MTGPNLTDRKCSMPVEQRDWSDAELAQLATLWQTIMPNGKPMGTKQIGLAMGRTKNAIIGKAHRLGLLARPSPIIRDPDVAPRPPSARAIARLMPASTLPPLASGLVADPVAPLAPIVARRPETPRPKPTMAHAHVRQDLIPVTTLPSMERPAFGDLSSEELTRRQMVAKARINATTEPTLPALASVPIVAPAAPAPRYGRVIECCWPDPVCSEMSLAGKPYCAAHCGVAFVKVALRADRNRLWGQPSLPRSAGGGGFGSSFHTDRD
jgi:GcrA cell cycle regulator